jgi:enoyl-CoA hydratase/carnithine racemase
VCGPAVGIGTTMLFHCDLVYAGDNAAFSMPFVNLGLCPEAASSLLVPQMFGYHRAAEALLLGEPFMAEAALEVGLVNRVLPPTEANNYAQAQARKLAAKPLRDRAGRDQAADEEGAVAAPGAAADGRRGRELRPHAARAGGEGGVRRLHGKAQAGFLEGLTFTIGQVTLPLARWALQQGLRDVCTVVADYASGVDAESAFVSGITAGGGRVGAMLRVPLATLDYSAYMLRLRELKPQAVFFFLPSGQMPASFLKFWRDRGMADTGIRLLATGDATDDNYLEGVGELADGLVTSHHYSFAHECAGQPPLHGAFETEYGITCARAISRWRRTMRWPPSTRRWSSPCNARCAVASARAGSGWSTRSAA